MNQELEIVAKIRTGFNEKFGIPRQSGLVGSVVGEIIFEPKFRSADAVKGLEEYSHIWLLWGFSKNKKASFSATVKPPRLGGKISKGVFATRSPYRPNAIGLSSVVLKEIRIDKKDGPILVVEGADLLDGTPIYDIKPYLAYTDSHPDARGSFADNHKDDRIEVIFPEAIKNRLPGEILDTIREILAQDPRAAYNKKEDYVYGMSYDGYDIRFTVVDDKLVVDDIVYTNGIDWSKVK